MDYTDGKIDAVITWVDGDDPHHRQKRLKTFHKTDNDETNTLPSGVDTTRFSDNNEIKYCIYSIIKFAPWIRNIYIVTDNQTPDFLTPDFRDKHNVHIVDHKDIFRSYEWALPTFNTRTIESALWRIPGLASRFIYFNDDFVITKKVEPIDFFDGDKTVLQGTWNKISNYGPLRLKFNDYFSRLTKKLFGITRSMHTLLQIRSAQLAGFDDRYFYIPHVPHPIQTATLSTYFEKHPELFEENIKYPFRSTDQFSAIFLANYLDMKHQRAVIKPNKHALMIHGEMDASFLLNKKLKKIAAGKTKFVCLQAMESFKPVKRQKIENTLNKVIGISSENGSV